MGNNSERRKELISRYKQQKDTGGICVIKNTKNGRYLLTAEKNTQGSRNRFAFSQSTGSCVTLKVQQDWKEYGPAAFTFEVLEEMEQKETQTDREFTEDLSLLLELWREKFDPILSY